MTPLEAAKLCKFAKAACPQQAIDELTPDAWHLILEPYRFEDCREALVNITRAQPFVAPSEIVAEVKRIRSKRITEFGPFEPPPNLDVDGYNRWLGDTRRRIADGELTQQRTTPGLVARDMPALEGVFPHLDESDDDTKARVDGIRKTLREGTA